MKCPYKYCNHGGVVKKENAIYYKSRYYHKDCYNKKINKTECRDLLKNNYKFNNMNINNSIKQLVDDKGRDSEFVLIAIKYIINNKKPLNSPYGISYYLEFDEVIDAYKSHQKRKVKEEIKSSNDEIEVVDDVKINKVTKEDNWWKII